VNSGVFGLNEHNEYIAWAPHAHHTLVAGGTGSGKTSTTYAMLAGAASDHTVQIVGVDPSSLLLAPFQEKSGEGLVEVGTRYLGAAALLLERVVDLMDTRTERLSELQVDVWPLAKSHPRILVVLEEYGGLLAACESQDGLADKAQGRLKPRVVRAVGRLLREGRKSGILVFTIIQRPDAQVIGGSDRSQYSRRIAHRLDNSDGVRMLFEHAHSDLAVRLSEAMPGVGYLQEPGTKISQFRSFHVDYRTYLRLVSHRYRSTQIAGLSPSQEWKTP